jgi:hypothetical protein
MSVDNKITQDELLVELGKLLSRTISIDRENAKTAYTMINDFTKILQRRKFACSGKCLNCDVEIQYGELSKSHAKYGDGWLESFRKKWKMPMAVEKYGHNSLRINGYSEKTVMPYLCGRCQDKVFAILETNKVIEKKKYQERLQNEVGTIRKIILGETKVSPSKRFQVLCNTMTEQVSLTIKEMPYREFLESNYWKTVKNYKLQISNWTCDLCNAKPQLNVHHKTYDNHGEEHLHLEDLIVLCKPCHAKFHDKLVE